MRMLPEWRSCSRARRRSFDTLFTSCYADGNPSYIRIAADEHGLDLPVEFGRGVVVKEHPGADTTVATAGPILGNVVTACSDLPVNILYFPTIKPMDRELLAHFGDTRFVVVHDAFGLFEAINASSPSRPSTTDSPTISAATTER
jgi:transketolase